MATVTTLPDVGRRLSLSRLIASPAAFTALGTAVAFLLLGYHPFAEDGGIYAAALAARLQPSLFPAEHAFPVAHTGRSLFVPLLEFLAQGLSLSCPAALLLAYAGCLAATVAAGQSLASVLFRERAAKQWAAVTLVVALGLPVAGTSLYLADPYVTARSVSTPLLLWAIAFTLRRRVLPAAGCFLLGFALHPMMTASTAVLLLCVLALRSSRPAVFAAVVGAGTLAVMAALALLPAADTEAVRAASISRSYWFLSRWSWYELAGLLAPLLLTPVLAFRRSGNQAAGPAVRQLALAATLAMLVVTAGVILLVHPANGSMLLARVQPLRLLHSVYAIFMLLLGGTAGRLRLLRTRRAALAGCAVAAVSLLGMQRALYPHSAHIELPWTVPANGYEQSFVWARDHTPQDALFAIDSSYTTAHGEDAQVFRAVALRSSLPDAAKDGGIASVMPQLAAHWQAAAVAQTGLAVATDDERLARVRPLGATWIVLPSAAQTHFDCPYTNPAAKVCRLP